MTRSRVAAEVDALEARRSALSDDVDALSGTSRPSGSGWPRPSPSCRARSRAPTACRTLPPPALARRRIDPPPPGAGAPTSEPRRRARAVPPPSPMTEPRRPAGTGPERPWRRRARTRRSRPAGRRTPGPDHAGGADGRPVAEPQAWSFFDEGPTQRRPLEAVTRSAPGGRRDGRPDRSDRGAREPDPRSQEPVRWPIPPSIRNRRSPPSRRRSSPSGRATRRSRPRWRRAPPAPRAPTSTSSTTALRSPTASRTTATS